jgi:hypothetical protein
LHALVWCRTIVTACAPCPLPQAFPIFYFPTPYSGSSASRVVYEDEDENKEDEEEVDDTKMVPVSRTIKFRIPSRPILPLTLIFMAWPRARGDGATMIMLVGRSGKEDLQGMRC